MLSRSCHLLGLFLVLLALMVQLSAGATGPRLDPVAQLVGAEMPCHMTEDAGNTPAKPPLHPADCLLCPFCIAAHPQIPLIPLPPEVTLPRIRVEQRAELPPPSRAPPFRFWSSTQPRAPPSAS